MKCHKLPCWPNFLWWCHSVTDSEIPLNNLWRHKCSIFTPPPLPRITSLVLSENILKSARPALEKLSSQVKGNYDVIIASAVSSNHYLEIQKMLKEFHKSLYPVLKNFTLVIVDIGLTKYEKIRMEKHCRCQVISFPFNELPPHFRNLRCFAWKPYIIAAMLSKTEVVMWADSSTRFTKPELVNEYVVRTKSRGVQIRCGNMARTPYHTVPAMFEAYGDSPCAHFTFRMVEANFGLFHSEPLVVRAVVEPWLACASRADCMCPPDYDYEDHHDCSWPQLDREIGICNRFDQSALSIVLEKLFRENLYHFAVNMESSQATRRHDKASYFDERERRTGFFFSWWTSAR